MNCKSYSSFFQNFANKAKLNLMLALQSGQKNVTELCAQTGQEQSAVSHSLSKLCACNIIAVEQKGRERVYSLNKDTVVPLLNLVKKHVQKHCCARCNRQGLSSQGLSGRNKTKSSKPKTQNPKPLQKEEKK